jgi:hypothetical protein
MLIRNLASDETGTWRIVFTPEERHLYIEFKRVGRRSNVRDWITFDDFLQANTPKDGLHQQALDRLIELVIRMLDERG